MYEDIIDHCSYAHSLFMTSCEINTSEDIYASEYTRAQLVERGNDIAEVLGSNPVLNFFQALINKACV